MGLSIGVGFADDDGSPNRSLCIESGVKLILMLTAVGICEKKKFAAPVDHSSGRVVVVVTDLL